VEGYTDRLRRPFYFSKVDRVRQRTDFGKYSFVNRSIENWNQLPADTLCNRPFCVENPSSQSSGVPRNFVQWEGVQQIQLRTEGRENGDLGTVAP
jgi:hypothetical protein